MTPRQVIVSTDGRVAGAVARRTRRTARARRSTSRREMVVAVFLGSRPTAGYSVEIVGATDDGGVLVVQYRETRRRRRACRRRCSRCRTTSSPCRASRRRRDVRVREDGCEKSSRNDLFCRSQCLQRRLLLRGGFSGGSFGASVELGHFFGFTVPLAWVKL